MILNNIFSVYILNEFKALEYGFKKIGEDIYELRQNVDNNLYIKYTIHNNKYLEIKVFDVDMDEEYFLFENKDLCDGLVYSLREKAKERINKIIDLCFESYSILDIIDDKIYQEFKVEKEYPFKDDTKTCIYRGKKGKWFAIIMYITWDKLKNKGSEIIPVMNIKLDPKLIQTLIDNKTFFECYHMNKKHWISIALTKEVNIDYLMQLISMSFNLTNQ